MTDRFRFIRKNLNVRLRRKTLVYVFGRLIIDAQHRYNPITITVRAMNSRVLPANIVHMNAQPSGPFTYLSTIADIFVNSGHAIIGPEQEATQQLGIVRPTMEKGRCRVNEVLMTEINITL
jgi:hypothetical protein